MGARGADGVLRGLEPRLAEIAAMGEPVRLAFSGGIASLLLGTLIRKRADLDCVVAGLPGAADLRMVAEERLYLDFSVTEVRLSPGRALAMARGLARRHPEWPVAEVLDAVPLEAVRARFPQGPIVTGLGGHPVPRGTAMEAPELPFVSPLMRAGRPASLRPRLVEAANALGLPSAFVRAPPRRPAAGSGIAVALKAVSREKRVAVARLVRP